MRQSEPPGGGASTRGGSPSILAGVASVAQMKVEENPGRAGSVRTSGAGPSAIALDFPSGPSAQTILRTGFIPRA